jgi:hypothetical protein
LKCIVSIDLLKAHSLLYSSITVNKVNKANKTMEAVTQSVSCAICIEPFNKTIRKRITCENCEIDICAKCIKRYLYENLQQPCCMQCRTQYSTHFLDTNFSKKFRKETLQKIRDVVLVEREKQFLPQLMHRADSYIKYSVIKKEIASLWSQHYKMTTEKNHLKQEMYNVITASHYDEQKVQEVKHGIVMLEADIVQLYEDIKKLQVEEIKYSNAYRHGVPLDVESVVPCITANCNGYLDNEYHCRLCCVDVCKVCHKVLTENHECLAEDIETVKAIKNDTHPCPNCQTRIYKIDGCDQIFCTQCHTAFSWETGRIETGRIHNPHYFQWIRTRNLQVPREAGDVPCGGFPHFRIIEKKLIELQTSIACIIYVREILKFGKWVETREVSKYPVVAGRNKDMDLYSIQYLAGDMTEKHWKKILYDQEVMREVNTEKRLLLDMLLAVLIDYMNSIHTMSSHNEVNDMLCELDEFRKYYNSSVEKLKTTVPDAKFKAIRYDWSAFV